MANLLALLITIVFQSLWWAILIRVLMSWLPMANIRIDPYHPAVQFLYSVTNPIMEPLRPYFTISMIDLSPIVALIGLQVIEGLLLMLLGVRSF
ncbi:YggT family protein [Anaerolineales bacterium HSG6]|nr:YggT family protein [Anaerolineales bacterium HSG6]MDM8530139.1 YggT family protein [Anaerolineales bacterium HSG25]